MNTLFLGSSGAECSVISKHFKYTFRVDVSPEFIQCADTQLTHEFKAKTGLPPGKQVSISISSGGLVNDLAYIKSEESKISLRLFVNHNWNPITITWKSKSGRIYNPHDADLDCCDVEFHFEHLDAQLYISQLFTGEKLPFKIKDPSYELEVLALETDCGIKAVVKSDNISSMKSIIEDILVFTNKFNITSEKKNRQYGVVHSISMNQYQKIHFY